MYTVRLAKSYEEWKASNSQKIVTQDGKVLSPYVDADNESPKEIVSGTEAPKNIMPGSPLEGMDFEKESSPAEVVVEHEVSSIDYTTFICSGLGFIFGCLVTALFFKSKIKKITKEFELKIEESRKSLDRIIQMISQK